jgi:hypothetical protein
MERETVENLFVLFSGETDLETYAPIIDVAIMQTENQVKDKEYLKDVKLPFYTAALANLSYMKILALKTRPAQTYAGNIAENIDSDSQIKFAVGLAESYRTLCKAILIDDTFDFISTGGAF